VHRPNIRPHADFTGPTGKLLMEQRTGTAKEASLELGANAPFIDLKRSTSRRRSWHGPEEAPAVRLKVVQRQLPTDLS
jgi:hypothetical protein